MGVGAGLTWKICKYLRLDIAADYYKPKSRCSISEEQDKIRFIPVTAGLAVGGPVTDWWFLYFGGGTGWSFNDGDADDMEIKDSWVWFAYGLMEFFIDEHLAIQAEYRYTSIRPDVKYKPADILEKDVSFDHMEVRLGLAFYF